MQQPADGAEFRKELRRVLESESLRNSESLRRLLSFLGEASLAGTARSLKEYTIGREVMGKPEDYDPRVDASVRVQIGKLRQKLEQYYTQEDPGSAVQIQLPKGHFEVVLARRQALQGSGQSPPRGGNPWRAATIVLAVLLAAVLAAGVLSWRMDTGEIAGEEWTAEMRQFWGPFLDSKRPLVVVLGSPLFVRFHNHYFRNPWANTWEEVERQVPLKEMAKLLNSPTAASETHRWTPLGEATAAFRLATVLAPRKRDIVLKRSTALAWEDVGSSNLVFLGPRKFNPQVRDLPVQQDFIIEMGAIRNLRPLPGERAVYQRESPAEIEEIPEDYALITRLHGVEGWGEVLVLAASSTEGTWAAAEFVTRPAYLRTMLERLREPGGEIPACYQVLLFSRFKGQVPIRTEYLTHHVLNSSSIGR